jgi:hypothetical protein
MGRVLERRSYVIRDDATEQEVASACKAALVVLWEDLEWFEIDLSGLDQASVPMPWHCSRTGAGGVG